MSLDNAEFAATVCGHLPAGHGYDNELIVDATACADCYRPSERLLHSHFPSSAAEQKPLKVVFFFGEFCSRAIVVALSTSDERERDRGRSVEQAAACRFGR